MKIRAILISFLLGGIALAEGGVPEPKDGATVYVVRTGDTLSNISQRFFGNPLLWHRLWDLNPNIDNPNRIYPGQSLALKPKTTVAAEAPKVGEMPDLPVVKISPETVELPIGAVDEPPPPVFYYSRKGHEGFIAPDEWENMGTILSSEPPKVLLGDGDIVYVNVGWRENVRAGDKFTVFRTTKPALHPLNGRKVGYKVALLGEVEIIEVLGKDIASATITNSYKEITRGARIRPAEPIVQELTVRKGSEKREGIVVETLSNVELSGRGDVVYIDLGEKDDVVAGNTFSIYKLPRASADPDAGKPAVIPPAVIGKLLVLNVQRDVSSAIIIESSRQIEKGDMVSLDF
ncbi:MAG: LysM peptidoglycan-binding domain-containing protein [Deltaproteobacteria bacterium]